MSPYDDDDDWVGTPPEGRYTRDRAKPEFWWRQKPIVPAFVGIVVVRGRDPDRRAARLTAGLGGRGAGAPGGDGGGGSPRRPRSARAAGGRRSTATTRR